MRKEVGRIEKKNDFSQSVFQLLKFKSENLPDLEPTLLLAELEAAIHPFPMVARDPWGKWPLAMYPDSSWWHHHTSLNLLLAAAHVSMDNR